ncbi:hypothetical protein [Sulfitobacter sp. M22]|uniref:hypothetical protein n=1 Tax=Sulfitobacter sp. M22 TaxID=2675332 RepID=UPI001F196E8C|nr:hypothetical protein [Sulfitobacter sp. M22]MCF7727119.1 hypothetical protein [Sulfitobacter sp. M22]
MDTFDPWRAPWVSVTNFYRSLGIDVLGLLSGEPADHRIEIPEHYFKSGTALSQRTIPLHRVNRPEEIAPNDRRLVALKRRILRIWAMLILNKKSSLRPRKKSKSSYSWGTAASEARGLVEVARVALIEGKVGDDDSCPDGLSIFIHLTKQDLLLHAKYKKELYRLNAILVSAREKSLFDDWFEFDLNEWSDAELRKQKSSETGRNEKPDGQNQIEPFEDEDLATILENCVLLSDLTDDLIVIESHAQKLLLIEKKYRTKELRQFVLGYEGRHLKYGALPFLWMGTTGRLVSRIDEHSFPWSFVRGLMRQVQIAHMQLLNFLLMMRAWETEHLPFDAVRKHLGTDLHLMTSNFAKMAFSTSGDHRDWPLSPLAVKTIERQQALTLAMAKAGARPKYLFSGDDLVSDIRYSRFWDRMRDFQGRRLINEQRIVPTRYRASACRLVVLAELGGDNIARQIMGHRDLATTMGYANANGKLASELLATRTRVQQVFGKHLLDDYCSGRLPKRSLKEVSTRLASIKCHVGEGLNLPDGLIPSAIRQLGTSEVEDIESMLGEGLQMTAPGVFCNRRNDQIGACRNAVQAVNPGQCNENKDCMYRLESGAYVLDQAERIEGYLGMLAYKKPYDPKDFGFYHIAVALLDCFDEIHGEVEEKAHDLRVHEVLDAIDGTMFEELLPAAQRAMRVIHEIRTGQAV